MFLYLHKSLDYPKFLLSFVISLKLNIDFSLLSLTFGISLEYL